MKVKSGTSFTSVPPAMGLPTGRINAGATLFLSTCQSVTKSCGACKKSSTATTKVKHGMVGCGEAYYGEVVITKWDSIVEHKGGLLCCILRLDREPIGLDGLENGRRRRRI